MAAKKKQLSVFWLALLLMLGALIAGVVYSYSMFHSIVPTRATIDDVANRRENGSPDDVDPFAPTITRSTLTLEDGGAKRS